jgi:putative ABC transport system ATP-binding protein
VLELIAQLREQTGKTFIIATHDPVVASHADHAIRIVDGLIAEIDPLDKSEDYSGRIAQSSR